MDTLIIIYVIVSLLVIIFQSWLIHRLRKNINFAADCLRKFSIAILSDDSVAELERINDDIKNFR